MKGKDPMITRQTTLEQLIAAKGDAGAYLAHKGIRCIRCGEPVWDSVEHAARRVGYTDAEIDHLVDDLNCLN